MKPHQSTFLPIGHFTGPFASFLGVIESLSQFASVSPWNIAIDAHVEELTVIGIFVPRMGHRNTLIHHGALEVEHIVSCASLLLRLIWPRADSCLRIKDQTRWTGDHVELSVDTVEEFVTGTHLAEVAMLPGTVHRGLRRF